MAQANKQAEIRTNMDTVVVNVQNRPPYDESDRTPAKFKYVGVNPTGTEDEKSRTTVFGKTFVNGEAVEVTDPMAKFKLRGNPHFQEAGGKKEDNRVAEDNPVDPEAQGETEGQPSPARGSNYESMRPPFASILDIPNPLSKEEQEKTDEADREAGRPTIAESGDPKAAREAARRAKAEK